MTVPKIAKFLHIVDDSGQLDIIDLSFMATMGKIMLTPGIDWTAVCAMVPVILAKMHRAHITRVRTPEKVSSRSSRTR